MHDHTVSTLNPSTSGAVRPGRLRLRIEGGDAQTIDIEQPTFTVGRESADVVVRHPGISKIHFVVRVTSKGIELTDAGSKNGIWWAQRRVDRVVISPGDTIYAGDCRIQFLDIDDVTVQVSEGDKCGRLMGRSVIMRELFAHLARLGRAPLDVAIFGETGTGKELTAETLHALSPRKDAPFVVLDCACLPSTLADGTLFGFVKGGFTGADRDQAGLFEQADGGTLFIDEIGELALELQTKLLRALDKRQVSRLGEPGRVRDIDVRVFSATNRNLELEVQEGRFREDLYYRLRDSVVKLPALRDRGIDKVFLAEHFVASFAEQYELQLQLGADAGPAILDYNWPGNVRQLRNAIRQAVFLCNDGVIRAEDLNLGRDVVWARRVTDALTDGGTYEEVHSLVDRHYLPRVLIEAGSITGAARKLGISRDRLRAKMRELELYDVL